ncbi:pseudouridine synthase [Marinisporobacter balticus]|uniref:Pseudouridine synthase n=1 Tax=Marinisporobacter balticus TaxID=2018667 RepID=A0A4R2KM65_9FIRM|nr:pseudouridine synthase [Marinisporobacter balticus]TCO75171.1 ribosomal small subunit pseudouridine synthase A [Marinisporobacter balticus]
MAKTKRIDKILSNMGYGARKDIKNILRKGRVKVDGKIIKSGSMHVNPYEELIEVDGEKLVYKEFIYIMMNKPQDVISASFDKRVKTVIDLLEEKYKIFDPFPVGRLDKDTEGLLLLTNDGKLAHELLSPKKHVPKTYFACIEGMVTKEDIFKFKEGVTLEDGYKTKPAELHIIKSEDISEIELIIYEGKFHQVKRMFESVGKEVIYLKRITMGGVKLDESLELGEYREISEKELEKLKNR